MQFPLASAPPHSEHDNQGRLGSLWISLLVALLFISPTACFEAEEGTQSSPTSMTDGELAVSADEALNLGEFRAIEVVFAHVWNSVPTFSGFWYDEGGQLVIGLTNPAHEDEVVSLLGSLANGSYLYDAQGRRRTVAISKTTRNFATMIAWKRAARSVFSIQGVHGLDYAESENQIVVQVSAESEVASARMELERIGVPEEKSRIEIAPAPVATDTTMHDRYRPVVGGFEITNSTALSPCTLGFNVIVYGDDGFMTNSHCTPDAGSISDTVSWFQEDYTDSNDSLGVQVNDPPPFACGQTYYCRYSDAAFFMYDPNVSWAQGYLANIDHGGSCEPDNSGTPELSLDSSTPHAEITAASRDTSSAAPPPAKGDTVYHIGKTTGETKTEVIYTNKDNRNISSSTAQITFLDQYISGCSNCYQKTISQTGDSGGPVYRFDDSGSCGSKVVLDGIRWGTNAGPDPPYETGTTVRWSHIDNIEDDFSATLDFTP